MPPALSDMAELEAEPDMPEVELGVQRRSAGVAVKRGYLHRGLTLTGVDAPKRSTQSPPALETGAWRVTEVERFSKDDRNAHSFTLYTLNRTGTEVAEMPTFLFA